MRLLTLGYSDDALTVASLVELGQRADLYTELMLKALEAGQTSIALRAASADP